jgi:hypothetical protein
MLIVEMRYCHILLIYQVLWGVLVMQTEFNFSRMSLTIFLPRCAVAIGLPIKLFSK